MLSISEFSEMCDLTPQTLRHYHAEGLLVPAGVDGRTGYRSYAFGQVERAMLITALRGTGMGVPLVRRALDRPDEAAALLREHVSDVRLRRRAEDEAIADVSALLASPPEPVLRHVDGTTVVSKPVPGPSSGGARYDWDAADATVAATVRDVVGALESCGAGAVGTPWRTLAAGTPEQRSRMLAGEGPHWLVTVPVTAREGALAALPAGFAVETFESRNELAVFVPGRSSMAKHATALSRLLTHPLHAAYVDTSRTRHLLHPEGVETAMAVEEFHESGDD
ncbi:MerR family transcriptional regulator [uncultured Streptomyces sp.]|uniref:MerR family transcriptional regulator n=1 Tax=uncultured Streptomyces sp. TaxID=174707 RepID=UPI00261A6267|nr:MerR family transcriptional regulator [uncultured Streptomyces sp.]